jgi:hypothetical protein
MMEEKMLDRVHFRFEDRLVLVGRLVEIRGLGVLAVKWRTS